MIETNIHSISLGFSDLSVPPQGRVLAPILDTGHATTVHGQRISRLDPNTRGTGHDVAARRIGPALLASGS